MCYKKIIFTLDFVKIDKRYQNWFIRIACLINLIFLNRMKANTEQTWEIMKNLRSWKNTIEIQGSNSMSANAKMFNWIGCENVWLSLAKERGSSFAQACGGILMTPWARATFHPWPCVLKEWCSCSAMWMQGIIVVWAAVHQRPFVPRLPGPAWHGVCQWL